MTHVDTNDVVYDQSRTIFLNAFFLCRQVLLTKAK
jgi:hypothetical protein